MAEKYPARGSSFGGLSNQPENPISDGSYARALDAVYEHLRNGSGKPPSDARMDFIASNLALAQSSMKKIKT